MIFFISPLNISGSNWMTLLGRVASWDGDGLAHLYASKQAHYPSASENGCVELNIQEILFPFIILVQSAAARGCLMLSTTFNS